MAIEYFRPMEMRFPGYGIVTVSRSVKSTNEEARIHLQASNDATRRMRGELSLVATAHQTGGRGRFDREWTTPEGMALCTSYVVRPHANPNTAIPQRRYHWFTMLAALAALDTWAGWGVSASIKWPNDVLVGEKKVCGILAQLVTEEEIGEVSAIVGIGMNLNFMPEDLPVETASSALIETGKKIDHTNALKQLSGHFARYYFEFSRVAGNPETPMSDGLSLLDRVRAKMSTLGLEVTVHLSDEKKVQGVAQDISADGEIIVRDTNGAERRFSAADVVHLRPQQ